MYDQQYTGQHLEYWPLCLATLGRQPQLPRYGLVGVHQVKLLRLQVISAALLTSTDQHQGSPSLILTIAQS